MAEQVVLLDVVWQVVLQDVVQLQTATLGHNCTASSPAECPLGSDIIFVKFFTPAQFQDFENLPEKSA